MLFVFLGAASLFMVFAWYAHLKNKRMKLWLAIPMSWVIAFFEYCFHVPANRFSFDEFSLAELKVFQEIFALIAFLFFARFFLKESLHWRHALGMAVIFIGAIIIVHDI